ncbi:regulatory NPR1 [Olea europaea subsp. europaea]|uniref:Regulatory NPR1 n=1 Tax=Olea europaea subsp. europaea TaxID=158383 RepID=A0A8S0UED2_OLEEU|nr:regulatory NPR1 [Olea europaea subsp. europaea]
MAVAVAFGLSNTLASIIVYKSSPPDFDFFSDAKLVAAGGREIPVQRCILSSRSPFFKNLFANKERNVKLDLKEVMKEYETISARIWDVNLQLNLWWRFCMHLSFFRSMNKLLSFR